MFFDREKIKKERFLFWLSVWGVSMGLILWAIVLNMFRESTTVTAEVVDEYVSGSSVNHHSYGSKINIEWTDADGDLHTEGNLANSKGLTVGDTLQIQVDADTQSQRILDGPGKLVMFLLGAGFVGLFAYPLLSFRKGEEIEPKPIKRAGPVGRVLIIMAFYGVVFYWAYGVVAGISQSRLIGVIGGGLIALAFIIWFLSYRTKPEDQNRKGDKNDLQSNDEISDK